MKRPHPTDVESEDEALEILPGTEEPDWLSEPEPHLKELEVLFMKALELREKGKIEGAQKTFKEILHREPRLAEPRLELACMLLEANQLDEAESEARESLRILDAGGQWTLDIAEHELKAHACLVLGEVLRRRLEEDEAIFGDAETYRKLADEARGLYARAAELNPEDAEASFMKFTMGPPRA